MDNNAKNPLNEISLDELNKVSGGLIVDQGNGTTYWLIRQDGTVIAPAPSKEKALEFAKTLNISTEIIGSDDYVKRFGRELKW